MNHKELILYNGSTGSIACSMPKHCTPVKFRLEDSDEIIKQEILKLTKNQSFTFINFAAITDHKACNENPKLAERINSIAPLRIYKLLSSLGCKVFFQVSSSHVYGKPVSEDPITINHPLNPISIYGKTKLNGEQSLLNNKIPETKLIIGRVFSVLPDKLRPGFLLTGLTERAKTKDYSPIPGLYNYRDFLTPSQVCEKIVAAISKFDDNIILNICSGIETQIFEIAMQVFQNHGLKPPRSELLIENNVKSIVGKPSI